MFEPDTLLPEQFFTLMGRKPLQSEKRLLLAMLEDAVHCFQTYLPARKPHERRLFQEAEEWIDSADAHWYFSFENICDILGIHPGRLRTALKQWKEKQTLLRLHQMQNGGALVTVMADGKDFSRAQA